MSWRLRGTAKVCGFSGVKADAAKRGEVRPGEGAETSTRGACAPRKGIFAKEMQVFN
jgi:hypothetical protein